MSGSERLDKVLSNMGYGSRNEVRKYIREGIVSVNSVITFDPGYRLDPVADIIKLDDEQIIYRKYIYLMMSKPEGFVCSTSERGKRTVMELIPESFLHYDLFPVGRLDEDSTGLLLISNDGEWAHRLLSPRHHVEKEYIVTLDKAPDSKIIEAFYNGVVLDKDFCCKPAGLILTDHPHTAHVVLTEGKYHQVKRMFAALGLHVCSLKRIRIGGLILDEALEYGSVRELTAEEITALMP